MPPHPMYWLVIDKINQYTVFLQPAGIFGRARRSDQHRKETKSLYPLSSELKQQHIWDILLSDLPEFMKHLLFQCFAARDVFL